MADLDAMLNDAAGTLVPTKTTAAVQTQVPPEIKPWLAFTANVPKEYRDKWSTFVKLDHKAVAATALQPSNNYRSWDTPPNNTTKLLSDLVRKASTTNNYDEIKIAKLHSIVSPVIESDVSKQLQQAYAAEIISDLKEAILADPNYNPEKFPNLALALAK